jgi:hypothetical protein
MNRSSRSIKKVVATTLAVVGLGAVSVAFGGAAEAAVVNCPGNNFCLYDNANGDGDHKFYADGSPGDYNLLGLNDRVSAVLNNTSKPWVVTWDDTRKKAGNICVNVPPGTNASNMFVLDPNLSSGTTWDGQVIGYPRNFNDSFSGALPGTCAGLGFTYNLTF